MDTAPQAPRSPARDERSRDEASQSPRTTLYASRGEPPPPTPTSARPRFGLAFILNDSSTRDSTLPARLPQRRPTQWTKPVEQRDASERRPLSMESLVWPEADAKRGAAQWHSESIQLERRDVEVTAQEQERPTLAHRTADERDKQEKIEEKAEARPAPHTTTASLPELTREEKRRGRTCRVDGCDNYIVHKGLCCRHGGARKCSTEGCDCTAKYMGLCWKHGGSTWCKVDGCSKRAKAKGRCWAHGGGTACTHLGCTKVAVSNGLCWAHGGGKRCLFDGCNRPGYERTHGFCDRHFDEVREDNYFEV